MSKCEETCKSCFIHSFIHSFIFILPLTRNTTTVYRNTLKINLYNIPVLNYLFFKLFIYCLFISYLFGSQTQKLQKYSVKDLSNDRNIFVCYITDIP